MIPVSSLQLWVPVKMGIYLGSLGPRSSFQELLMVPRSPYHVASRIPPNRSSANLLIDFPNEARMASVEIDKPKTLGEKLWRSSAYVLALFPGAVAADAAARALMNAHSTVVVTRTAPIQATPGQPQMLDPKSSPAQSPHTASPMISFLRTTLLAAGGAVAIEALKEAGKDLWKVVKKKLWPEAASSEEAESPPSKQPKKSGKFVMTVAVDESTESDALEGTLSEPQLQQFVTEKPIELHQRIQSKRSPAAKAYSKRKQSVHIDFTYTPAGDSSAGRMSASVSIDAD